jgi:tryptophan halogenase
LGKELREPFESLEDILPNNSAWATKIPYVDKESDMVLYTNCCAIDNGWVWNIPLWSRMGSGYVYSDRYVSDEDALYEFKNHLKLKGHNHEGLEFKNLKMRVGIHKRLWVKNVCAIGLSGGFIEPLESGGLFTTHEFLLNLVRILDRGHTSEWDRNAFNFICRDNFQEFSEFVALHYALSHRDDTEYWKDNLNRDYSKKISTNALLPSIQGFTSSVYQTFRDYKFRQDGGFHCIATGMNWFPTDVHSLNYDNCTNDYDIKDRFYNAFLLMDKRKEEWNRIASNGASPYKFLKKRYENLQI